MEAELELRGLRPGTCALYLTCARRFAEHCGRAPGRAGPRDVDRYLAHLAGALRLGPRTRNVHAAALRFLFTEPLRRPALAARARFARTTPTTPRVLSSQDVLRLWSAATTATCQALIVLLYGAGLRVTEACTVRVGDVDMEAGVLRVRDGKGGRARYVPLGPRAIEKLGCESLRDADADAYILPGRAPGRALTRAAAEKAVRNAARAAGLHGRVTPHTLRHSFATHAFDLGRTCERFRCSSATRACRAPWRTYT